ncbi:MAG: aldo/keto reductase [Candidatus Hydrogenedentes bacterium]|nr:aldo/keto reductase [Candidatus Hydrogenedentota bacterium]
MNKLTRRDFITRTVGVVAAGLAVPALAQNAAPALTATTLRPLGKTGLEPTLLGMGTGVKAWGGQSELSRKGEEIYLKVVTRAYEAGIRYFDMADMYGSHAFFSKLLKGTIDRDKVMLLTKTTAKEAPIATADIERFRTDLGTDKLDVVLMHCMTDKEWPKKMAPVMDVLEDAKAKGLIKAHGVSCHTLAALKLASESPWVDVVLSRINPYGIKMDAEPEKVVPVLEAAHRNGKGVLGMKIAGEGQCADRLRESLKFVVGLGCVDAMPVGFLAAEEVDDTIAKLNEVAATAGAAANA